MTANKGQKERIEKVKAEIVPNSELEESVVDGRTMEWEENHAAIANSFVELMQDFKRKPTITEIAKSTGYHYNTVHSHIKILAKTRFDEKWASFKILSEQVVLSQAVNAIKGGQGSAASAKLFFEIVENWKPGIKLEISGNLNFQNMTTSDLIKRQEQNGKFINNKLLRFAKINSDGRRTGSN